MAAATGDRSLLERGLPPFGGRSRGLDAVVLFFVRVLAGVTGLVIGVLHARTSHTFASHAVAWGLPAPTLTTWLGVALLMLFGAALLLGLASRLAALVLLVIALVMVATLGRVEGGLPLLGGGLLAVACLIVVARGGGAAQLLDRIDPVT